MAAGEDQLQSLVGKRRLPDRVIHGLGRFEQAPLRRQRAVTTYPVDRPVAAGGDEPGARVVRRSVARPPLGGRREGLRGGFLGELEVAEEADQGGENPPPLVAEDLLEDR